MRGTEAAVDDLDCAGVFGVLLLPAVDLAVRTFPQNLLYVDDVTAYLLIRHYFTLISTNKANMKANATLLALWSCSLSLRVWEQKLYLA